MLKGKIILENGDQHTFYLDNQEEQKLELGVQKMNRLLREEGMPENWNLAKEMRTAIIIYLLGVPYPKKEF